MVVTDYDSRRNKIMQVVVDTYVNTITPVSSAYVCQNCSLGLSSATIRNIMAELEDMGYLSHPHTSAGRVPTDKGYRLYVNELMGVEEMDLQEQAAIESELANAVKLSCNLTEPISKLLSGLTRQLSFVLGGSDFHFVGVPNMLEQPEFKDVECSRNLLRILEDEKGFIDALSDDIHGEEICIRIGSENKYSELQRCSIVVSSYRVKGRSNGAVGIIGPTRMAYPRLVKRVDYLADLAGRLLSGYAA